MIGPGPASRPRRPGRSEFRNEQEVLIPAAERFTVLSVKDDGKMIQVKVKRA